MSKCILCNKKHVSMIIAENVVFGNKFDIAFCSYCELYYFTKLPKQILLDKYYSDQYFKKVKESRIVYTIKSWFSKIRSSSQYKYITCNMDDGKEKNILEIGSADGTFLAIFKGNDWEIRGLEYNNYMIKKAKQKFNIQLEKRSIFDINPKDGKFDIIAFPHVLEHMSNPIEILKHCKKLLKPNGVIFIELPHFRLPEELDKKELEYFKKTTHIFEFRPTSLAKLIIKSNLRIKKMNRFFYRVPARFANSSKLVGNTLMKGKLSSYNIIKVGIILISVFNLILYFLLNLDPMKKIKLSSEWQGLGDNLRIIVKNA